MCTCIFIYEFEGESQQRRKCSFFSKDRVFKFMCVCVRASVLSVVGRQMVEKAAASFKIKREEELVSRQDDVCVGVCGCACITDAQRTISVYESVCVHVCVHV